MSHFGNVASSITQSWWACSGSAPPHCRKGWRRSSALRQRGEVAENWGIRRLPGSDISDNYPTIPCPRNNAVDLLPPAINPAEKMPMAKKKALICLLRLHPLVIWMKHTATNCNQGLAVSSVASLIGCRNMSKIIAWYLPSGHQTWQLEIAIMEVSSWENNLIWDPQI